MSLFAREILNEYLAVQASGDIDELMRLISDDAIFDVGRGQYKGGEEIRQFHERLKSIHSATTAVQIEEVSPDHVTALLDQRDDDLQPLGIEKIQLETDVITNEERIRTFTARPTPASLALIAAARDAGRSSEGVALAERAGNLPPAPKP
jgi:hypothetical protein